MKNSLLLLSFFIASCSSVHENNEVDRTVASESKKTPSAQKKQALDKISKAAYKFINAKRPSDCIMPYSHSIGFLYKINGNPYSRELFFVIPDGAMLENEVYEDKDNNTMTVIQNSFSGSTQVTASFDQYGEVFKIEGLVKNIKIKCE